MLKSRGKESGLEEKEKLVIKKYVLAAVGHIFVFLPFWQPEIFRPEPVLLVDVGLGVEQLLVGPDPQLVGVVPPPVQQLLCPGKNLWCTLGAMDLNPATVTTLLMYEGDIFMNLARPDTFSK